MSYTGHEFANQLRLNAAGHGDDDPLLSSFLEAVFFCEAPEHPGFLGMPTPHGPLIAVFTSESALARRAGACRRFSATGADLAAFAPVGHRFIIDPGSAHQLVVDPTVFVTTATSPAA